MKATLTKAQARGAWIGAQRLDKVEPFGAGPAATRSTIEHLGYVQIDTINVIERSHHHILFNRIPKYQRADLRAAQSVEKSVFEYWTHALSYVPSRDLRFFMPAMKRMQREPGQWLSAVKPEELRKVLRLIKAEGPISIRDIDDDVLVEKSHPWASRKPSKKALQFGFFSGRLVVSERIGMLKKYELLERHFDWAEREKPKPATEKEITAYLLDRSLRAQSFVSLDSICHLQPKKKPLLEKLIASRVQRGELIEIQVPGVEKFKFWQSPKEFEAAREIEGDQTHLLSPFDPLVIQRKRLHAFFDYDHRFEAYLPKEKRKFGYFTLPVVVGDKVVAAIDLKTDRDARRLLVQKWTWINGAKAAKFKSRIEAELHRFEAFQLGF
ncbi:crosslink repair DNA glycosylase YcaQ family protein [soil metagenome]